jgi:hypothetical protein
MLPDVTTATGAMYAQMDEKDFDQVSDKVVTECWKG